MSLSKHRNNMAWEENYIDICDKFSFLMFKILPTFSMRRHTQDPKPLFAKCKAANWLIISIIMGTTEENKVNYISTL